MLSRLICIFAFLATFGTEVFSQSTIKNRWSINCGVDKGAINRKGKTWTFTESTNMCKGGAIKQRAEIFTNRFSPTIKGDFEFSAQIEMKTASTEQFSIFSLHDGHGKHVGHHCSPPFQLYVRPDGKLLGRSGYLGADGLSCNRLSFGTSNALFKRTGEKQDVTILLRFLGDGEVEVFVWLNGKLEIRGRNRQPEATDKRSREFFLKHGVYSRNIFDYEMKSTGVQVRRVRTK